MEKAPLPPKLRAVSLALPRKNSITVYTWNIIVVNVLINARTLIFTEIATNIVTAAVCPAGNHSNTLTAQICLELDLLEDSVESGLAFVSS